MMHRRRFLAALLAASSLPLPVLGQTIRPGRIIGPAAGIRPSLNLDFINGYWDSRLNFARADSVTCATYRDSAGVRQTAAANVPRFDHDIAGNPLGLLIEPTRTNYLLNSTTPATQTTGSLGTGTYTLSCEGPGSVTPSAGTATITGAGAATEGSPNTFTVTVAGTVTVTKTGTLTAFQLEEALTLRPSSLIITGATTATRAGDVCSMPSLLPWFNATEGTLFAWYDAGVSGLAFNIQDGSTNDNAIAIRNNAQTNTINNVIRAAASATYQETSVAYTLGAVTKSALAYKENNVRSAYDGVLGTLDTSVALPTGLDRAGFGCNAFSGTLQLSGHLRRIAYWPRRLPDSVIQALTR